MSEFGEVIAAGVVRFERLLPGPIERVWKHLTDSELRGTWFASGPMEPHEGGALTLHFRLASRDDMINVAGGWHSQLDVLTERLSDQNPEPFWPRVERYEREYPARIR